jgi:hypothetical protein
LSNIGMWKNPAMPGLQGVGFPPLDFLSLV